MYIPLSIPSARYTDKADVWETGSTGTIAAKPTVPAVLKRGLLQRETATAGNHNGARR